MCLPDFIEFKNIPESKALVGYRNWINPINKLDLRSENQDYIWTPGPDGPHLVAEMNSGLYAYNDYNYSNYSNYDYNYNYYNYNNYNSNNNSNNYNYNYDYYLGGIILQYGRVAIHRVGQRSQYAKIDKLFKMRESDARGPDGFIKWIKEIFNPHIEEIAIYYGCSTINWQDFVESQK